MSVWLGLRAALEAGDQLLPYRVIGSDRGRPNVRIRQIFDRLDLSERLGAGDRPQTLHLQGS